MTLKLMKKKGIFLTSMSTTLTTQMTTDLSSQTKVGRSQEGPVTVEFPGTAINGKFS